MFILKTSSKKQPSDLYDYRLRGQLLSPKSSPQSSLTRRGRWHGAWWAASSSWRRAGGWPTSPAAPPSAPSSRGGHASRGGGATQTPDTDYHFINLGSQEVNSFALPRTLLRWIFSRILSSIFMRVKSGQDY